MLKSKIGSIQEVILPDFPDDDNTVTTTITKSRRVSFGTNFVKEFIVGSAVSAQCMSEYEQATPSSDSSSANSSQSVVESEVMDRSTFVIHDVPKVTKSFTAVCQPPEIDAVDNRPKVPKFSSTICFSADSPTADMEFTEGCLTLAKSILDKKNKEMTLIIQAKPKEPKDEVKPKEDETKYFNDDVEDESSFDMSMTRCLKATESNEREVRRFEESRENQLPLDMIIRHLDKDSSDMDSELFASEKSFNSLLNVDSFEKSNESEELNFNQSVDMSLDLQPNLSKEPQNVASPVQEMPPKAASPVWEVHSEAVSFLQEVPPQAASPVQEVPPQAASPVQKVPQNVASPVLEVPLKTASPVREAPPKAASPVREAPPRAVSPVWEGPPKAASPGQEEPQNPASSFLEASPVWEVPPKVASPVREMPQNAASPGREEPQNVAPSFLEMPQNAPSSILEMPQNAASSFLEVPPKAAASPDRDVFANSPAREMPQNAAPPGREEPQNAASSFLEVPPKAASPVREMPQNAASPVREVTPKSPVTEVPPKAASPGREEPQKAASPVRDMREIVTCNPEPSLIDMKVIENLKEQSKEPGCVWSLEDFLHPDNTPEGLLSFSCKLLESSVRICFNLQMSHDDSLYTCSIVTNSSIGLNEEKQQRLPEYHRVVEFGFEQLNKYYGELRQKVETIRHIPYFFDQVNSFMLKLNLLLQQILSVLTLYPGSKLKGSSLCFRLFSFPIFFSCTVSVDLTNLYRLSKSSLSFEKDFGSFDENKIREIFQDCLKCENILCEFIVQSTRYLIDLEKESGYVSKRGHIRLLPAELKL